MYLVCSMLGARRGGGGGGAGWWAAEVWLFMLTPTFGFQKILYGNDFPS